MGVVILNICWAAMFFPTSDTVAMVKNIIWIPKTLCLKKNSKVLLRPISIRFKIKGVMLVFEKAGKIPKQS